MPLGQFGSAPEANASNKDLADAFSRLLKEVQYLLNGGLDTLNVNELSADVINAGVLNAALVTVKAAMAGAAYILINGDQGLIINDGVKNTFQADINGLVSMVGAIIQSSAEFPKITFNLNNNIMQAFADSNNHVDVTPSIGGSPGMAWIVDGILNAYLQSTIAGPLFSSFNNTPITLQPSSDLNISLSSGNLKVNGLSGYTGNVSYVKDIISGAPVYGTLKFTKGVLTSAS